MHVHFVKLARLLRRDERLDAFGRIEEVLDEGELSGGRLLREADELAVFGGEAHNTRRKGNLDRFRRRLAEEVGHPLRHLLDGRRQRNELELVEADEEDSRLVDSHGRTSGTE